MSFTFVYIAAFILLTIFLMLFRLVPRFITLVIIILAFVPILNLIVLISALLVVLVDLTTNQSGRVYIRNTKLNRWLFEASVNENLFYHKSKQK